MRERVVLWGARRGDVQFGSTAWRRRRIPIGATTMQVQSAAFFDVWTMFDASIGTFRVVGMEGNVLGVESCATE